MFFNVVKLMVFVFVPLDSFLIHAFHDLQMIVSEHTLCMMQLIDLTIVAQRLMTCSGCCANAIHQLDQF